MNEFPPSLVSQGLPQGHVIPGHAIVGTQIEISSENRGLSGLWKQTYAVEHQEVLELLPTHHEQVLLRVDVAEVAAESWKMPLCDPTVQDHWLP